MQLHRFKSKDGSSAFEGAAAWSASLTDFLTICGWLLAPLKDIL